MTSPILVVLGTGGTIAGTSAPGVHGGYSAARIGVRALVEALPGESALPTEFEQLAQVDSKDMSFAVWQRLAGRVTHHLARPEVRAVLITHGTDTLEETAYFLHRLLAPSKPVVLVAAMRPATSAEADGPRNLLDGITVACVPGARGVLVVLAGKVHGAVDVRKAHVSRLDAFTSDEAGPMGHVTDGVWTAARAWPEGEALGSALVEVDVARWPRVDIVLNHAAADGALVDALTAIGSRGIVVAGTGDGTIHEHLSERLVAAREAGVTVWRSTRCAEGALRAGGQDDNGFAASPLSPVKARIELMLHLMAEPAPSVAGGSARPAAN